MRRSTLRSPFPAAFVLAVLVTGVLATGQVPAPGQEPEQPPRFRTEANYVRVDVYPTRKGSPVAGLGVEDFEVLEDGVRQEIRAFEHVVISPAGPQSLRNEPDSVRGGEQMAANPRHRVFVFFLDVPHVAIEGGHRIKEPLIRLMDRILGPDDLVAVMTPHMSAAQITFGRKTEVIAAMLREGWAWGRRHSLVDLDRREDQYRRCYPPMSNEGMVAPVVRKMIARRRERMVLDALYDLVGYLGGIREERKAILTVTEGWVLFRPDESMTRLREEPLTGRHERIPSRPPIGVDGWGTLRIDPPDRGLDGEEPSFTECDRERMFLASIDNEDYLRQLMHEANRHNASFYPLDPRGLAAFDFPMGPEAPPSLEIDRASLSRRIEVLRTLAENTDGLAVVASNDLDAGLQRIADDLTSYYLLGYYSSNPRLDGGYRRITVRVRQPGVEVRARRGYRAATAAEVNEARTGAAAPVPDSVSAAAAAVATLARIRPDQRFSINVVPLRGAATGALTALLLAGELRGSAQELAGGGTISVDVSGGVTAAAARTVEPGARGVVIEIPIAPPTAPIEVRARFTPAENDGWGDAALTDSVRFEPDPPGRPLLFRRGPSTGNRLQPAANFQFSRTERLRLELPVAPGTSEGAGRVLDRNGQPLRIPVQIGQREEGERGRVWLTADVQLSALAAGEYVVEMSYRASDAEQRTLTAIRVTR